MPVLSSIEKEFIEEKPFKGIKIALSVHLEAKTAYLCLVFAGGGAEIDCAGRAAGVDVTACSDCHLNCEGGAGCCRGKRKTTRNNR